MIVAFFVFILENRPLGTVHVEPFRSLAHCEEYLQIAAPYYEEVAARMSEDLGGEVTYRARCLDRRPSA